MTCFCHMITILVLVLSTKYVASQLRQEGAKINYCNPKYVIDCYAITRRISRGEPYKSNCTVTILHTWNNNVTAKIVIYPEGVPIEIMKMKLCDAIKPGDWVYEHFQKYLNVKAECPIKPGMYGLYNLEFPPKDTPKSVLKLLKNKFYTKFYFQTTRTEEPIMETTIDFHFKQ